MKFCSLLLSRLSFNARTVFLVKKESINILLSLDKMPLFNLIEVRYKSFSYYQASKIIGSVLGNSLLFKDAIDDIISHIAKSSKHKVFHWIPSCSIDKLSCMCQYNSRVSTKGFESDSVWLVILQ